MTCTFWFHKRNESKKKVEVLFAFIFVCAFSKLKITKHPCIDFILCICPVCVRARAAIRIDLRIEIENISEKSSSSDCIQRTMIYAFFMFTEFHCIVNGAEHDGIMPTWMCSVVHHTSCIHLFGEAVCVVSRWKMFLCKCMSARGPIARFSSCRRVDSMDAKCKTVH